MRVLFPPAGPGPLPGPCPVRAARPAPPPPPTPGGIEVRWARCRREANISCRSEGHIGSHVANHVNADDPRSRWLCGGRIEEDRGLASSELETNTIEHRTSEKCVKLQCCGNQIGQPNQ